MVETRRFASCGVKFAEEDCFIHEHLSEFLLDTLAR